MVATDKAYHLEHNVSKEFLLKKSPYLYNNDFTIDTQWKQKSKKSEIFG